MNEELEWHDKLLTFLLKKREKNQDLKFWLRQRNTKNKLTEGYWFQGNNRYISIGFSNKPSGNLSTQSISFFIWFGNENKPSAKIEILYKNNPRTEIVDCYKEIFNKLGGKLRQEEVNKLEIHYGFDKIFEFLEDFIDNKLPIIKNIITKRNLATELIIPDKKFKKTLEKTMKLRKALQEKKQEEKHNFWLFQGSPDIYNIKMALKGGHLRSWKVTAHKDKIKVGDKVIIWQTGKDAGCYALAEVTSNVGVFEEEEYEKFYYKENENSNETSERVRLKVEHYFVENPLLWKDIKGNAAFANLKAGNQGTNFTATEAEYNTILNLINKQMKSNNKKSESLNQIFFGPPGTGKTYHTINEAIKIADPHFYEKHQANRDELKKRFKLLQINSKEEGQIAFTTFHQSFSYEDFVEGIKPLKPEENDTYLKYKIEEGVFKKICRLAQNSIDLAKNKEEATIQLSVGEFEKAQFYKMSLGNTQVAEDEGIFDYCIKNNCVSIGFGDGFDLTGLDEKGLREFGDEHGFERFPIQALNYFKNYLKINDYVVVSYGNNYVRAIGKVLGEYEFKEETPFAGTTYNHFRKVQWLYTGANIPISEVYTRILSQQTIYKLDKNEIVKDFFVKGNKSIESDLPKNPKNYVLVIDEINRGNVSSIFGELITLIEPDKRAGNDEALSVILPYSKKTFSVPPNVFIVGTMNTADRSIEALDTALRRRFSFKEMPPKSGLILTDSKLVESKGFINEINLKAILDKINERIEKLIDKDHKIGHSYFLNIEDEADLKAAFKNKVIPLLEEYFFGDYGKIGLILGDSFIKKISNDNDGFASFEDYEDSIIEDLNERAVYKIKDEKLWDFESIYA